MTDKYEIDLNVRPGEDLLDEEMAGNTEERNHPFLQISRKGDLDNHPCSIQSQRHRLIQIDTENKDYKCISWMEECHSWPRSH